MKFPIPKFVSDLLLSKLRRELDYLKKLAITEPLFAVVLSDELHHSAVSTAALTVKIAEHAHGKRDDDLRAKQLEHMISRLTEDFTAYLKRLDDDPETFSGAMQEAQELRKALYGSLFGKPST